MNIKKQKRSLRMQYITLYLLAALVPATISLLALLLSYRALEKDTINSNKASLALLQQSLDTHFQDINNKLLLIQQDPDLSKHSLQQRPVEARSRLQETLGIPNLCENLIINIRGKDYYYTSIGNYDSTTVKSSYFINDLKKHGFTYEMWRETLNSSTAATFWPVDTYQTLPDYMYYFVPLNATLRYESDNALPSRTAAVIIDQNTIQELYYSSQSDIRENNLLFNSDMNLLSYSTPSINTEELIQLCDYLKTSISTDDVLLYDLNGESHLIFTAQSAETGLYYVRFTSRVDAFRPLMSLRNYTILILLCAFIIGFALIYYGVKKSYTPIQALVNWIKESQNNNNVIQDELQYIQNTFDTVMEHNRSLTLTIDNSRRGIINHVLRTLIQGGFPTPEAFQDACNNSNIVLNKKYFSACTIFIEDNSDNTPIMDFDKILQTIHGSLNDSLQLQVMDMLFSQKLIFVISSDSAENNQYYSFMNKIKEELFVQEKLVTSVGVGSFYESYEDLGKSYLESINALDYRIIYGKDCLIMPETYHKTMDENTYPHETLKELQKALAIYDSESLAEAVHDLIIFTKSAKCNLHTAKYICYDVFSLLKKMPIFSSPEYTSSITHSLDIMELTNYNTIDEFFTTFLNIIQNSIDSNGIVTNEDIRLQLVDYVNTNCFTYDFQISSMADHFKLSRQYILKLFKKRTGTTISEYVTNLKTEKAMQLLRDTDLSIQEIVQEIGNADVSGFIRLFKQKTGITPSQYRNNYKTSNRQ